MAGMTTPVAELPTTLAEAHALILALAEERAAIEAENSRIASEMATLTTANADLAAVNEAADARIVELTAIVKMVERTLYGTRSERLRSDKPSDEQIAFVLKQSTMSASSSDMMRPPQRQLLCDRYDLHVESRMLKEGPTPRLAVN